MFKVDWPKDDWSRFGPKDYAAERYRAMARKAVEIVNTPQRPLWEFAGEEEE